MAKDDEREKAIDQAFLRMLSKHIYSLGGQASLYDVYLKLRIEPPLLARLIAVLQQADIVTFDNGILSFKADWREALIGQRKVFALRRQREILDWVPDTYKTVSQRQIVEILPIKWRLSKRELIAIEQLSDHD